MTTYLSPDSNLRVQQTFLHFWSSHQPTRSTHSSAVVTLQRLSNIPLGSKFLTDLSTFKLLHFGMLYHTIFALILILLNLILFSHYLLLNSTSSWKLPFFFIPTLLSLSLYWTDSFELWSNLFISFIILFISYTSFSNRSSPATRYDMILSLVCLNQLFKFIEFLAASWCT